MPVLHRFLGWLLSALLLVAGTPAQRGCASEPADAGAGAPAGCCGTARCCCTRSDDCRKERRERKPTRAPAGKQLAWRVERREFARTGERPACALSALRRETAPKVPGGLLRQRPQRVVLQVWRL